MTVDLSGCLWDDIKWTLGLVNYGRIEGTITDTEGVPIEGIHMLLGPQIDGEIDFIDPYIDDDTDEDGKYRLDKVPVGDDHMVSAYDYATHYKTTFTIDTVVNARETTIVNLTMRPR